MVGWPKFLIADLGKRIFGVKLSRDLAGKASNKHSIKKKRRIKVSSYGC